MRIFAGMTNPLLLSKFSQLEGEVLLSDPGVVDQGES